MVQNDSREKEQTPLPVKSQITEDAAVVWLERLAFKLHDLANRLLRYIS